jgi:Saccharopine dehydrogenase C-terminal domain/Saccharopine dehydrogenase NADP binding domain
MVDLIAPTGRVHWVGTGMSTGSGLGIVCATAETTLWGRTRDKADSCLRRLDLSGRAKTRAFNPDALAAELRPGDLVVSMLPASWHAPLVRLCLENTAHFACSSYVSPEITALAVDAARIGVVALTEAGLDPGIDHLLTHKLVAAAKQATSDAAATTVRFTSYCGSFPAVPNDFRYRFAWAPRGVLTALKTPARYIDDGLERTVPRPYRDIRRINLGGERFEVYPNRNSIPFVRTYRFPPSWRLETFVRGTVRLDGWARAWAPVFAELDNGTDESIGALAEQLAERYPTTASDRDRVVMFVALEASGDDGSRWSGEYALDVVGDDKENATPRLVSVALAGGIREVVAGRTRPGLNQATDDADSVERWLGFLGRHGITSALRMPAGR